MPSLIRDAYRAVREAVGKRGILTIVVLCVVAAPFIVVFAVLGLLFWPLESFGSWANSTLRGVGQRRDDPIYGPVVYQGYSLWHAEVTLDALGGRLTVEVPGTRSTGPRHEYAELLRELAERQHEIARQTEESIFREYQALAPAMRQQFVVGSDWLSEEFDKSVPILEQSAQIWTLLSDGVITLEVESEQPGSFMIGWQCTWGVEYGDVTRYFANWQLEENEDD